jgi:hypothetical protein
MLNAFKSLPIVRTIYRLENLPGQRASMLRTLPRWAGKSGFGRGDAECRMAASSSATTLARGTVASRRRLLRARSDRHRRDGGGNARSRVRRCAAAPSEWALFAYHIGNCHQPLMVTDEAHHLRGSAGDGRRARLSPHSVHLSGPAIHARRRRGRSYASAVTDRLLPLLHLCDSLFPTGAFAHSDGLEWATDGALVASAADLGAWMDASLSQLLARADGPVVWLRWHAYVGRDWRSVCRR